MSQTVERGTTFRRASGALLGLLLLTAGSAAAKVSFTEGFEGTEFAGWGKELPGPAAGRIVASPVRSGKGAARFECTRDQPIVANSKRAEITRHGSGGANNENRDCWFGWSLYLPADWQIDPQSPEIVTQWHEQPDIELGEDWRSPPLALLVRGDRWLFDVRWDSKPVTDGNTPEGREDVPAGTIDRGAWTDWVLHVRWSYRGDGLLEVWKNGEKVVNRRGPNCYNDRKETYFKTGVYKWDWKSNPQRSVVDRRVLYVDEIRWGDATSSYEEVAPHGKRPAAGPRPPILGERCGRPGHPQRAHAGGGSRGRGAGPGARYRAAARSLRSVAARGLSITCSTNQR